MKLEESDLQEFRKIWQSVFHEEIPMEEARIVAAGVMQLYSLLGQPRDAQFRSKANQSQRSDEIFPVLQKIKRKRGSAGSID